MTVDLNLKNLTQIAMFLRRSGYTKQAARLLVLRAVDIAFEETGPTIGGAA